MDGVEKLDRSHNSAIRRGALTVLFLSAIGAGLLNQQADERRPYQAVSSLDELAISEPWEPIGTSSDGINTYVMSRFVDGLHSFRGVVVADMHISRVLAPFCDLSVATSWIEMLYSMEEYPYMPERTGIAVIHQWFDLPWPVADRDLVMRREWIIDNNHKNITIAYRSVEDYRIPHISGVIRAHSARTVWRFKALPEERTQIDIETVLDSKGFLPAFLANYIQRSYPKKILRSLVQLASKNESEQVAAFLQW